MSTHLYVRGNRSFPGGAKAAILDVLGLPADVVSRFEALKALHRPYEDTHDQEADFERWKTFEAALDADEDLSLYEAYGIGCLSNVKCWPLLEQFASHRERDTWSGREYLYCAVGQTKRLDVCIQAVQRQADRGYIRRDIARRVQTALRDGRLIGIYWA